MHPSKLMKLLKQEEGFKLDFKLKLSLELESEKKEFVKDVIAIANTEGGRGYILFGVEDQTKRIVGLKDLPENIEERIQQVIASRSVPPVPVSFELMEMAKKQVGILTIFKSRQVPHQMLQNGAFYVRRGSTTGVATRHELAKMLQAQGIVSFELTPCRQAALEDLDFEMIEQSFGSLPVYEQQKTHFLQALGILVQDTEERVIYPTYGGLMLFGKCPQLFLPHTFLEVIVKEKRLAITGNILSMLRQFEEKIYPNLSPDYPFEGLKEVVINALLHRDYWNNYEWTQVKMTKGRIKVSNPSPYLYYEQESPKILRTNAWLYSRLLLLATPNEDVHFGIGLERVTQLFGERLRIDNDLAKGVFEVTLEGNWEK